MCINEVRVWKCLDPSLFSLQLAFPSYLLLVIAFNSRRIKPPRFAGPSIRISKFKSPSSRAQPFICLRLSAIWNDQCFMSTRRARGRSLIKLLKDFRRRPRSAVHIAIRGFKMNFRSYLASSRFRALLFFLSARIYSTSHSLYFLEATFSVPSTPVSGR